jgi:hypothetical protein
VGVRFTALVLTGPGAHPAYHTVGRLRLKRDGTSLREEAGVKGKPANGVGTQLMKREKKTGHSWPSVTTNNDTMCTLRLLAAD